MLTAMLAAVQDAQTLKDAAEYAAREAASPDVGKFSGGDALGFLLAVLLIVAVVALIWWLINHNH